MAVVETDIAAHRWVAIDPGATLAGLPPVRRSVGLLPEVTSLSAQIGQNWSAWTPQAPVESPSPEPMPAVHAEATPAEPGMAATTMFAAEQPDEVEPAGVSGEPRRVPDADIILIGRSRGASEPASALSALPRLNRFLPKRLPPPGLTTAQRVMCLMLATAIASGAIYVVVQAMRPHVIYVPATASDRSAIV